MRIDELWIIIKRTKFETPLDISCDFFSLISDRLTQVKAVEQKLQIESTEEIFQNMTDEILNAVAEMYIYLISCPDPVKPWIILYQNLLQTESPDLILLTLNRLMKGTGKRKNNLIHVAEYLFRNVTSLLSKKQEKTENDTTGRLKTKQLLHFISV